MKVSEAIVTFLKGHPQYELLEWYLKFGPALETQVLVKRGNPVEGKRSTYTDDDHNMYWDIRIPKDADSNPIFKDYKLAWPLEPYTIGIGTTGWNWQEKLSYGWGYDFDAIAGHSRPGLTEDTLDQVREAASKLGYVSAFKSSGGKGLHLWIRLDVGFPTANHTEHAAIGRALLAKMSFDANFDFTSRKDVCGQNMWIWHQKATPENEGYKLIKLATDNAVEIPSNWIDHVSVINSKTGKVTLPSVSEGEVDSFESLANEYHKVPLDADHRLHIQELANMGAVAMWIQDYHFLHAHTNALKKLHEKLELKGKFDTVSPGTNLASPNCFMYPRENGGWHVYRFGKGTKEAELWSQNGEGYTSCSFNMELDHRTKLKIGGGTEAKDNNLEFPRLDKVGAVLKEDGINLPTEGLGSRPATVTLGASDGSVTISVPRDGDDTPDSSWTAKGNKWNYTYNPSEGEGGNSPTVMDIKNFDNHIRHLVTETGDAIGWNAWLSDLKAWGHYDSTKIKNLLQALGEDKTDAEVIMGNACRFPWKLVSRPFEPEYLGHREWNRNAIQLAVAPASRELDQISHPYFDQILTHIGNSINRYVKEDPWAQEVGISTGKDWLIAWIASLVQRPFVPLPFIFLYGPYESGKSILYEVIKLLFTYGVSNAASALMSQSDFNSQLQNTLVAYIDEKNISKIPGAAEKLREYITALDISIRKMRTDPFEIRNKVHWIQVSNLITYCPILPKETRTMVIYVDSLTSSGIKEIPKLELMPKLMEERAAFLRTLLDFPLPEPRSRLGLEIVNTPFKAIAEEHHITPLEQCLRDKVKHVKGKHIKFTEFYNTFVTGPAKVRFHWDETQVREQLPPKYPVGEYNGDMCIGNMAVSDDYDPGDGIEFFFKDGKLYKEGRRGHY